MENRKDIISENSINFNESTKRYDHSSGGWKSQTTPTNACKDDGTKLIVANISPLVTRPEVNKYLSYIFGCFEIDEEHPLHLPETELLLRANDCQANPETQVIIKFMRDPGLILADLVNLRGIDTTYVVTTRGVILDEKTPQLNLTIEDVLAHDIVDLTLARKVLKDIVVGLILLHTEIIFHGDIKTLSIVKCGRSWKLTDMQSSHKIGDVTRNTEKHN